MNDEISIVSPAKTINETELFMKYKSSYTSAFIDFSVHAFVMCSSFYSLWYFRNSWLSVFTIPLLGFMLNRNFVVFHDCCHNSYTPDKQLNNLISHITGAIVLTSPNWILDHHTHHMTNGNIENKQHYFFNETIILTKKQYRSKSSSQQLLYRIYKNPLVFFTIIPIVYFGIVQRFIYTVKKYRHPYAFKQSFVEITCNHIINNLLSTIYVVNIYNCGILCQYICAFIMSSTIAFITFHNQHSYNPSYVVGNNNWNQRDSGLIGSAFTQIPHILKYFYMGIEYHHIHHMNAKIPGYNLQKYHEEVVSKSNMFVNVVKLSMTDCYNNLWLVLYDEDKKRYITFAEADEEIIKDKDM
jgi:omega-6 fatty acid desaturase (delta-12 desaturase)